MVNSLYDYLCEVVGTKNIIEIRRSYFNILESYYNEQTVLSRVIFSGSKAEGLDLEGSDIDIMIVYPFIGVYDSKSEFCLDGCFMDTADASPGFAFLKAQKGQICNPFIVHTENGKILSNEKFKQYCSNNNTFLDFHVHGPCLSSPNEEIDVAFCLHGDFWPNIAFQWIVRPRNTDLPPELLSDIVREGILLVPIGSKFGSKTDNKYEWRLSFSQAEKWLIHSFNHTELLCYGLLKIILKEIFNQNAILKGLLCSYYMKTIMFWLKEELPSDIWKPPFLYHCFKECVKRLLYWVKCEYCPNYFVPENNMFAGKFENTLKSKVVKTLHNICDDTSSMFTNSKTLYRFLLYTRKNPGAEILSKSVSANEIDACIFPLMHVSKSLHVEDSCNDVLEIIYPILKRNRKSNLNSKCSNVKKFQKNFNLFAFAEACTRFCHSMKYNFRKPNKMLLGDYKRLLSHLLIGAHSGLTVWISVSVFFYQHKQYNNAIKAAEFCLSQTTPNMFVAGSYSKPFFRVPFPVKESYEQLALHQRFKLTCKEPFNEIFYPESFLHGCNLGTFASNYLSYLTFSENDPNNIIFRLIMQTIRTTYDRYDSEDNVEIIRETFGHFIRLMCYHNQYDSTRRNQCLEDIITSVVSQPEDSYYRWSSSCNLLRAVSLATNFTPRKAVEYVNNITCIYKSPEFDDFHNSPKNSF